MSNHRYIVSGKKYLKHNLLKSAQAEKLRLEAAYPDHEFIIYTVKKGLDPYGNPKPKVEKDGVNNG